MNGAQLAYDTAGRQREVPNTRRISILQAAHHPHMEQPALFNTAALEFLGRLDGSHQEATL